VSPCSGSLLASSYSSGVSGALAGAPGPAAEAARSSLGGALGVADQLGGAAGGALARAAQIAFVDGMGTAVLVGAGTALFGAVVIAAFLPDSRESTFAGHAADALTGDEAVELAPATGDRVPSR
jgi:hypothetical protein